MSQYTGTPIKDFYLDKWVGIDIPTSADDRLIRITPKYEGRPDLLSYDLYGTVSYWWVFALRNKDILIDPLADMKVGTDIYIVPVSTVQGL